MRNADHVPRPPSVIQKKRPSRFEVTLTGAWGIHRVRTPAQVQADNVAIAGAVAVGATAALEMATAVVPVEGLVGRVLGFVPRLWRLRKTISLGAELVGADAKLALAVKWIKPQKGAFDLIVHGSENAFHVFHNGKWVELNHRSVATFIQKNGWKGESIRLVSCSTGASPTGIAQNLANKLGTTVVAPNNTLWIHSDGAFTIGANRWTNSGSWTTFVPGGKP